MISTELIINQIDRYTASIILELIITLNRNLIQSVSSFNHGD